MSVVSSTSANAHIPPRVGLLPQCSTILIATAINLPAIISVFICLAIAINSNSVYQYFALLIMVLILWFWLPQLPTVPTHAQKIDQAMFPELSSLVAEVAAAHNMRMPDIYVSSEFTAGFARLGWRRKPALLLGHSMLSIVDSRELVTIVAHELAHAFDGAVSRSLYVFTASDVLQRSVRLLNVAAQQMQSHAALRPVALVTALIARRVATVEQLLRKYVCEEHRSAEYVADYQALMVSGQIDVTELFLKLATGMLHPVQHAYAQADSAEKYAAIRKTFFALPEATKQDIWTRVLAHPSLPNAKHPHISERIMHLKQYVGVTPKVILDGVRFGRIQQELSKWPVVCSQPPT